jgi:hypothetical protein
MVSPLRQGWAFPGERLFPYRPPSYPSPQSSSQSTISISYSGGWRVLGFGGGRSGGSGGIRLLRSTSAHRAYVWAYTYSRVMRDSEDIFEPRFVQQNLLAVPSRSTNFPRLQHRSIDSETQWRVSTSNYNSQNPRLVA